MAALEERYWHAFNDLSLQLGTHLQERDATLAKVCSASRHCASLIRSGTHVLACWHVIQHALVLLWTVCMRLQMFASDIISGA